MHLQTQKTTTTTTTMMNCIDNPNFASRYGLKCEQHEGLHCSGFVGLGFDPSEVSDLLKNCPSACAVPGCGGEDDDDANQPSSTTTSSHRPAWTKQASSLRQLGQESLDDSDFACYPGWEPTCQDDALYVSRLKSPCEAHAQFDCRDTYLIGFNEQQVHELVNACPCSCGIECGTFTLSPTSTPTATPTASPTSAPTPNTASPTPEPSAAPTASPTSKPTPSTPSPTAEASSEPSSLPTMRPTTSTPTASPSLSPTTSSPTMPPSFMPTSIPTAAPSPLPTVTGSFMPSSTPTASPTFGPTITRIPTVPPTSSSKPSTSMLPSKTPTIAPATSMPTTIPTSIPTIITFDPRSRSNDGVDGAGGPINNAVGQEQSNGTEEGADGMSMNLLIIAVGAGLIALFIIAVGIVLRKRLSSSREEEEYYDEDGDGDAFHDNIKPRDGVYGMTTQGEPYISPDGVIYTRHEVETGSKKKRNKKHKRDPSKVSITDLVSGVEVRRMHTLSQDSATTGLSSEEAQSVHEPIARISMMSGLRRGKAPKNNKKKKPRAAPFTNRKAPLSADESESHFDHSSRLSTNAEGQAVRVQKGLGRGRSRSRSKDGRTHSRSRSRSMPRQASTKSVDTRQANAMQAQQGRGRSRSRSFDSRKPRPQAQPQNVFEVSEQRIAERQMRRSRSRSRSRGRQSQQSSVPRIEPMRSQHEPPLPGHHLGNIPHISIIEAGEEPRHSDLQIEVDRSRSRSGRSQGGRYEQNAPRQSSADINPFTFVGDGAAEMDQCQFVGDGNAAGRGHGEFETRQFGHIQPISPIQTRRESPMPPPPPVENPDGIPSTIVGKARKHKRSNSNGQSRGAFMITESDDEECDESAVLNDLFTDSLNGDEEEEEGTEYTDISAISSRSIRSRIWEQMAKDLAAHQAAGMGPPMDPIHE